MEDINDFKMLWQEMNIRLSNLEDENRKLMHKVKQTNFRSTQEKLVRKYIGFIVIEFLMIVYMSLFFLFNPFIVEKYKIPSLIYWLIFFLIELIIDLYLMIKIKNVNVHEATITEVAKRAAQNWKLHKIGIAIGIPLAIGAVILFSLAINADEFIILGMIVGGTIGFIIGINQLFKFRSYYKLLETSD